MDIKEYIQSGIIESYVLGLANENEVAEIESLSREYPELRQAIQQFEISFETAAFEDAVNPPEHIRSSLEKTLAGEFSSSTKVIAERKYDEGSPTRSVQTRTSPFWKYLAAASVILLVVSTGLNFYFYSSLKNSENNYQALLLERNSLQANNAAYKTSLQLMEDPRMLTIKMPGVPGKEKNLATIYWNTQTKEVYVYPNLMDTPPAGKQYQLWAIVDGKPVDAGMIGDCQGLCHMKVIERAEAFAVTLENAGGSSTPTLSAMYVIGKT